MEKVELKTKIKNKQISDHPCLSINVLKGPKKESNKKMKAQTMKKKPDTPVRSLKTMFIIRKGRCKVSCVAWLWI